MIEVELNSIRVSLMTQHRIVLLKDLNAERYLPIWIGQFESEAITVELKEDRLHSRPMTHDLLRNVIERLGGQVVHILINDMRSDVFYARIVIEVDDEQIEMDSRPSDAIALAVRTKSPIFVSESVLTRHGVEPDEEIDLEADEAASPNLPFTSSAREEELADSLLDVDEEEADEDVDESQFSAFADFVNSLDLDELDDDEN